MKERETRGNICAICGTQDKLIWHHRDPEAKTFSIGNGVGRKLEQLAAELAKCDLLCSSCHGRLHHAGEFQIAMSLCTVGNDKVAYLY